MLLDTYLVKIDRDLGKEEFDRLLTYVSEEKRNQINRFYHFDDSQRALIGNVLARYAICSTLNIKNRDIVFAKNEYGKPLLLNSSDIDFNISHSGYWVACAISNNAVGIDVEVAKTIDFEIAGRFFSEEENSALLSQPADERLTYFYKIWTIKESYIKAEGKGLNIPLDSFTVDVKNNTVRLKSDNSLIKNSIYHSVLDNRSVYAICAKNTDLRHETVFSTEQFFEKAVSVL